jgi:hypothetical protein
VGTLRSTYGRRRNPDRSNEPSRSDTPRERRSNLTPSISRSPTALTACRSSTLLFAKGLEASSFDGVISGVLSCSDIDGDLVISV